MEKLYSDCGVTYKAVHRTGRVWDIYLWFSGVWMRPKAVVAPNDDPTADELHRAPRYRKPRPDDTDEDRTEHSGYVCTVCGRGIVENHRCPDCGSLS